MSGSVGPSELLERLPTGIPGLDVILNGGFPRGGIYLIIGSPGSGKTILSNQMSFQQVAGGGRVLYVTLLAETHARMLTHLRILTFFDPTPIGDRLYYVSGYRVLQEEGLAGLLALLRRMIREQRANLLVLDGLVTAGEAAESQLAFKQFIHELQVYGEASGCTTLLLTPSREDPGTGPGHTMVDGLIELHDRVVGLRAVREIEIRKLRGTNYLRGRHLFEICDDGIVVYPRTEALLATPPARAAEERRRLAFSIPRLDEMLRGGLMSGSTTMLLGPPGAGKTLLSLHFLAAGARAGEQGLYFGFYETPPRLIAKANEIGLDFSRAVDGGQIVVLWQAPLEELLDAVAARLMKAVREHGVRRLVIDGLGGFEDSEVYPTRISRFFTALTNELRALDVTTLLMVETQHLFGPALEVPIHGVGAIVDNIVFLRYVELHSQLYRLISIMKVRESAYDPAIREFKITDEGIDVAATFASAEAILTGVARPLERLERGPGTQEPV